MLVMAPEGTCGDGRCILQFRRGCFLPGVPLLPILFTYGKTYHNPAWTVIYEAWHFVSLSHAALGSKLFTEVYREYPNVSICAL